MPPRPRRTPANTRITDINPSTVDPALLIGEAAPAVPIPDHDVEDGPLRPAEKAVLLGVAYPDDGLAYSPTDPGTDLVSVPDVTAEELAVSLREGEQPTDIAGYVFQAVGAAGVYAPFGPNTGEYREDLARTIAEWATSGVIGLMPVDAVLEVARRPGAEAVNTDGGDLYNGPTLDRLSAEVRESVGQ